MSMRTFVPSDSAVYSPQLRNDGIRAASYARLLPIVLSPLPDAVRRSLLSGRIRMHPCSCVLAGRNNPSGSAAKTGRPHRDRAKPFPGSRAAFRRRRADSSRSIQLDGKRALLTYAARSALTPEGAPTPDSPHLTLIVDQTPQAVGSSPGFHRSWAAATVNCSCPRARTNLCARSLRAAAQAMIKS